MIGSRKSRAGETSPCENESRRIVFCKEDGLKMV